MAYRMVISLFALAGAAAFASSSKPQVENLWQCGKLDNTHLCKLAEADQKDRTAPIDWSKVTPRDEQRKKAVLSVLSAGDLQTPGDYFHAALIMQHGEQWDDFATAHLLSVRGLQLKPLDQNLQRMNAAAWDRMMHSMGHKQWFGTNTFRNADGTAMPKEMREDRVPKSVLELWSKGWDWPPS